MQNKLENYSTLSYGAGDQPSLIALFVVKDLFLTFLMMCNGFRGGNIIEYIIVTKTLQVYWREWLL
jgi:hypothetical protein